MVPPDNGSLRPAAVRVASFRPPVRPSSFCASVGAAVSPGFTTGPDGPEAQLPVVSAALVAGAEHCAWVASGATTASVLRDAAPALAWRRHWGHNPPEAPARRSAPQFGQRSASARKRPTQGLQFFHASIALSRNSASRGKLANSSASAGSYFFQRATDR